MCERCGPVIRGEQYRITVLTPYLLRLEYSALGEFVDEATQVVVNRQFDCPEFRLEDRKDELELETCGLRLTYRKGPFTPQGLRIALRGRYGSGSGVWQYGDVSRDLKGTARTLDEADGAIPLGSGVLSKEGWTVLDDSASLICREDGVLMSRRDREAKDLYFFGYGRAYLPCLKDYHQLTGQVPLLPKYVLGNWWSRYYPYTQAGYLALMDRFAREEIPFTVAVIDMDWHLTDVDPKYGRGWTGYTWNRALFPDHPAFLDQLHQRGMKVTLNVHPADGVRGFEACYPAFARFLGMDPEREEPIPFRPGDPKFMEGYFTCVHHPLEAEGVDFWWIDWQQGCHSDQEGLDPLWVLNHRHYQDSMRTGRRGLIFSRYAGPGSHRYPVGFSGDTIISWASLAFQPYFTATASNIGYGWWSHDIGGHMQGIKDDELSVRWVQFGVFSPIMRLHSSSSEFNGKEPWRYNQIAEQVMKKFLRLRHRLIPYLNTMNYRAAFQAVPLVQPMYYHNPWEEAAYQVDNQYYFGSELVVCPITEPADRQSGMASCTAWLPKGRWLDLFTGMIYAGDRRMVLHRGIQEIPVLLREGGILPLDGRTRGNDLDNPPELEVHIFPGAPGSFTLWEDGGDGFAPGCETTFTLSAPPELTFTMEVPQGNREVLPERRSYRLVFWGLASDWALTVEQGDREMDGVVQRYDQERRAVVVELPPQRGDAPIVLRWSRWSWEGNRPVERTYDYLNRAEIPFAWKEQVYDSVKRLEQGRPVLDVLGELQALPVAPAVLAPVQELLLAWNPTQQG